MIILGPRQDRAVPASYGTQVQVHWDAEKSWWVIHGQDELLGYSYGPLYLTKVSFETDEEMFDTLKKGLPPEWPVFYITGVWTNRLLMTAEFHPVEADPHDGWLQDNSFYFRVITDAREARLTSRDRHGRVGPGIWARRHQW